MDVERYLLGQFLDWEVRGRGWLTWPERVALEPPFRRFRGHHMPAVPDDGRRTTPLSRFGRWLVGAQAPERIAASEVVEDREVPAERSARRPEGDLVELSVLPSPGEDVTAEAAEMCLLATPYGTEPLSFELVSDGERVWTQFVCHESAASQFQAQLSGHFSSAAVFPRPSHIEDRIRASSHGMVVDMGLAKPFMIPLTGLPKGGDLHLGLVSALAGLEPTETGVVQILLERVHHPWSESMWRAVTDNAGGAFFSSAPEMLGQTREKVSRPLFAVLVRLAVASDSDSRCTGLIRSLVAPFGAFKQPGGNYLVPLEPDPTTEEGQISDLLERETRRSGMILNLDELLRLVHVPRTSVNHAKFMRRSSSTKAVPERYTRGPIVLGVNEHQGVACEVRIDSESRTQHMHVIGTSGRGKSTLLLNLLIQDAQQGNGLGLLDPHGDLVDQFIRCLPESRWKDVVLLDAADEDFPFALNILSAHSDLEKTLLAADLVAVFQRLSTSWGDQMTSILGNAILAFLESERGGTIADLRRFLVDQKFRKEFVTTVKDPEVRYYWEAEYPILRSASLGPLLTRLDTFLRPKVIRHMVGQRENRLDVASIMDDGKILLAKLPQGLIGESNSYLLGALLIGKFQQMAIARQAKSAEGRRPFFLYVDEFHHFVTPSMATILSGARKYQLGLTLAHQELKQLQRDAEVASAVLSNAYLRVCFHVGDQDARWLAEGFRGFGAADLQGLNRGEAICRIGRSDLDFNLRTSPPPENLGDTGDAALASIREASQRQYARPRAQVEKEIAAIRGLVEGSKDPFKRRAGPQEQGASAAGEDAVVAPEAQLSPAEQEGSEGVLSPTPAPTPTGADAGLTVDADDAQRGAPHAKGSTIKERILRTASALGFSYEEEKAVFGGEGLIDLVLTKGGITVACEISGKTTAEHEVRNIQKCLRAGYEHVVSVCDRKSTLEKIALLLRQSLDPNQMEMVQTLSSREFLSSLAELATEDVEVRSAPQPAGRETPLPDPVAITLTAEQVAEQTDTLLRRLKAKLGRARKTG